MSSNNKELNRIVFQVFLFVVTFLTTTVAGAEWSYGKSVFSGSFTWSDFVSGLYFSVPLILILTVHEFGHYFMAMFHRVKASLPYYIPIPPIPYMPFFSIGTFGAVIRLREKPQSNLQNFDIGLAGPLAGFVVAILFLIYGFSTLPSGDYVFKFHPEYEKYGLNYADHVYSHDYIKAEMAKPGPDGTTAPPQGASIDVIVGKNLLFLLAETFVTDKSSIPNSHELMHYPILLAVYFALFITSLNLLPIGQLDGGHVAYGLFGYKKHKIIATIFFVSIMFFAGIDNYFVNYSGANKSLTDVGLYFLLFFGFALFLFVAFSGLGLSRQQTWMLVFIVIGLQFLVKQLFPNLEGYSGWLLLGFLLGRFVGIQHPPSEIEKPLDSGRILLGWLTLLIFVLCFSPEPLQVEFIINE
jgi:membrane-associated protease RseP (regulator of RpoE activity)